MVYDSVLELNKVYITNLEAYLGWLVLMYKNNIESKIK